MDITAWLEEFKSSWENKDIERVLALFDNKVEYWESPSLILEPFGSVANEWLSIKDQFEINLDYEIFSSDSNKHSITWALNYKDPNSLNKSFSGTYLVELNDNGKCIYFHHTCEEAKK